MSTILVVDDRGINRELIVTLLGYKGHRMLEAADGAEGLALVRSERPDLVISDILMPTMDGYEFVRQMRADATIAATKVIFHTAHYHQREARTLAASCGVSHVLLKPSEPEDILEAVDQALALGPRAAFPAIELPFDREHLRLVTDKLSASTAELRSTTQRLAALTDVNLQLASEKDPLALLRSVCRDARELIGARFAVICVRDKSGGEATFSTTSGIDAATADTLALPRIDAGIFASVLNGRGAHRFVRAPGDISSMGLPAGYPLVHSALAAPIASLTVVYGWVCLLNKLGADGFDDDDERILTSLASQVGRIYETGSLYAELQRQTDMLRESELRFRQLADNIDTVFFLVDPAENRTLYVSPAYETIWGRSIESVYASATAWTDAIVPEDRDRVLAERYASGNTAGFETEFRIARPDGGVRWIRSRGFPIRGPDGHVYRIAGVAEDITQQVHLERVLRESEAAMRRGDVIAKLAHIMSRPDGSFQSWSDTLPQLIGREPALVPASTRAWLNIVHPEDRDRFRAVSIEAGIKGVRCEIDYRIRRGNGEIMHVRQVFDPIRDPAKAPGQCRWFNTLQDVTAQKHAEEQLRESERRFSDMLANVQLVSLMLDPQAKILYCNDYLLTLTGWRREEVLGRDWFGLFIPPENSGEEETFGELLRDDPGSRHHENEIVTRSGERRLICWNNSVLRSPTGEVIGTASIGEDITERKTAEDEVRRLNANLERLVHERTAELQFANRELETFSYSVSHDLRAPLHAMQGYAQALKESPTAHLSEQDRHYLDRIGSGGASMDLLIDDLLGLARISRADLVATEVDLSAIATEVLSALRATDPARATRITVHSGMRAHGDAGLLRIALTNLLANAWKFSGGREVTAIEVGQLDDGREITTFFVQDQGAGFDPAYSQKLFGTFQRLHSQTEFPGTGIGLATVRRVIERHGGTVWAEGAVGQGATFYFALPRKADSSTPREP